MKFKIFLCFFFIVVIGIAQEVRNSYGFVKSNVIDQLYCLNKISLKQKEDLTNNTHSLDIIGAENNYFNSKLKFGIYQFNIYQKTYFVLLDEDQIKLVHLDDHKSFVNAFEEVVTFCNKHKYCYLITEKYISKIIIGYYNVNTNLRAGYDINCTRGIFDLKMMP
jgi:hypothetical protein